MIWHEQSLRFWDTVHFETNPLVPGLTLELPAIPDPFSCRWPCEEANRIVKKRHRTRKMAILFNLNENMMTNQRIVWIYFGVVYFSDPPTPLCFISPQESAFRSAFRESLSGFWRKTTSQVGPRKYSQYIPMRQPVEKRAYVYPSHANHSGIFTNIETSKIHPVM